MLRIRERPPIACFRNAAQEIPKQYGEGQAHDMDFLRDCAKRLDEGEDGASVLELMKQRYTTLGCLSSKASLVRRLCSPTEEYVSAVDKAIQSDPQLSSLRQSLLEGRTVVRDVPPRLGENASTFKLTRGEVKACKRKASLQRIVKNSRQKTFHARGMLASARRIVREHASHGLLDVAQALMLLTGRRTCEVMNGVSSVREHGAYCLSFEGQAKKRGRGGPSSSYLIPCLEEAKVVCEAWEGLRKKTKERTNEETSRRYQSELRRSDLRTKEWVEVTKTHQLRGLYSCMCVRLFEWGGRAPAYVTMCVLGHTNLDESLVYTPFDLGKDFAEERELGEGTLTDHHHLIASGMEEDLAATEEDFLGAADLVKE